MKKIGKFWVELVKEDDGFAHSVDGGFGTRLMFPLALIKLQPADIWMICFFKWNLVIGKDE